MTVGQLIEALVRMPADAEVVTFNAEFNELDSVTDVSKTPDGKVLIE